MTMIAINDPGIFLEKRGVTTISNILPMPTPKANRLVESKFLK